MFGCVQNLFDERLRQRAPHGTPYDLAFFAELKQNDVRQQARQSAAGMAIPRTSPLLQGGRVGGRRAFHFGQVLHDWFVNSAYRRAARRKAEQLAANAGQFVRRAVPGSARCRRVSSTIPKNCRLSGQDHATEQMLRAKSCFNLKRDFAPIARLNCA
jgi:hypothetical protein